MNVSKIVWSAKDQAKVIEAKEKKKHSMQMSSSYIAKSEYAQSHNKESPITIKNVEEGNVQMTNGNVLQGTESLDPRKQGLWAETNYFGDEGKIQFHQSP